MFWGRSRNPQADTAMPYKAGYEEDMFIQVGHRQCCVPISSKSVVPVLMAGFDLVDRIRVLQKII